MPVNPFSYTDKTFISLYNTMNTLWPDKPDWLKVLLAGRADVLHWYLDARANNLTWASCYTREQITKLAELINYMLSPAAPATVDMRIQLKSGTSLPKTLLKADLIATTAGTTEVPPVRYESLTDITIYELSDVSCTFDNSTNKVLASGHNKSNGDKISFYDTAGTLPAELSKTIIYYVINATTNDLQLSLVSGGDPVTFTDNGTPPNSFVKLYSFYQGETITDELLGQSDGSTKWQEFELDRTKFLSGSSSITIGVVTWNEFVFPTSFIDYDANGKVYIVWVRDDDTAFVRFGNNTYGEIPPSGTDMTITYRVGGGIIGNVSANRINTYLGTDNDVDSIINPFAATGGAEKESIEKARRLAPVLLAAQQRAVKSDDFRALAEAVTVFGGVSQVAILKSGVGSVKIPVVPSGGGNPTPELKDSLSAYLTDITIIESIQIIIQDPNYVITSVTAGIKLLPGYDWTTIQTYADLAFNLITSEKTFEIKEDYISNGVASAIRLINSTWSYNFGSADYNQITKILDIVSPKYWGDDVYLSDLYGIDSYIEGIDYIDIDTPSDTVVIALNEISQEGTHTINQL